MVRALEKASRKSDARRRSSAVTKEYPDGRLDLVAEGRQRFEVMELNRGALVPARGSAAGSGRACAAGGSRQDRAIELHREILSLAGAVQDLSGADQIPCCRFILRVAAARSRFQTEIAGDALGERAHAEPWRSIWKRLLPNLHARRGRERRPAATGTRADLPYRRRKRSPRRGV